jgi:hypothetical protein
LIVRLIVRPRERQKTGYRGPSTAATVAKFCWPKTTFGRYNCALRIERSVTIFIMPGEGEELKLTTDFILVSNNPT